MTFRPLTADDIAAARDLWPRVPGLSLGASDEPEALVRFFDRNPGLSWGAFDGERLAATVLAGHDGRRGILYHLAVDSEYRGHGLSTELLKRALSGLAEQGAERVYALALADNAPGLAFWDRGERQGWRRRGDVILFSKDLS